MKLAILALCISALIFSGCSVCLSHSRRFPQPPDHPTAKEARTSIFAYMEQDCPAYRDHVARRASIRRTLERALDGDATAIRRILTNYDIYGSADCEAFSNGVTWDLMHAAGDHAFATAVSSLRRNQWNPFPLIYTYNIPLWERYMERHFPKTYRIYVAQ